MAGINDLEMLFTDSELEQIEYWATKYEEEMVSLVRRMILNQIKDLNDLDKAGIFAKSWDEFVEWERKKTVVTA